MINFVAIIHISLGQALMHVEWHQSTFKCNQSFDYIRKHR